MEVQDLIDQQARKYGKTKKAAEDVVQCKQDADIDEIYRTLHNHSIVSVSDRFKIESF